MLKIYQSQRWRHHKTPAYSPSMSFLNQVSRSCEVENLCMFEIWCFWVNYNELTATSLEIMVNKGNHPKMALIQMFVAGFARKTHEITWMESLHLCRGLTKNGLVLQSVGVVSGTRKPRDTWSGDIGGTSPMALLRVSLYSISMYVIYVLYIYIYIIYIIMRAEWVWFRPAKILHPPHEDSQWDIYGRLWEINQIPSYNLTFFSGTSLFFIGQST